MIRTFLASISLLLMMGMMVHCGSASSSNGTTIKGTIDGSGSLQAFFDKFEMNNKNSVLQNVDIDNNGSFAFNFEEKLEPGIYRLRIGSQRAYMFLNGSESSIQVKGNLPDISKGGYTVEGSDATQEFNTVFSKYVAKEYNQESLKSAIGDLQSPYAALLLAQQAYRNDYNHIDIYQTVLGKLKTEYPESPYTKNTEQLIASLEATKQQMAMRDRVKVGGEAPDINLPDPSGKERSLSDLKGKVVLLDFWASWCRPCRMENPNVVNVYNKYNREGFEVFSVSLDRQNGKQAWINAIEKDGLTWPYHVSDLQYWNSAPAKMYGVSGIPRTFLIDKDGKIAAVNPRGPKLEPAVKKLLAQT